MERSIAGFHCDEHGDWVADLDCGHSQHMRHRPPFQPRPWVTEEAGRQDRIGTAIECPRCDEDPLGETGGGESACYAHLVCPECGALIDRPEAHRPGCRGHPGG